MSAADERARAMKSANQDFSTALLLAQKISEAWYRCQSLAAVARFAPSGVVIRVADKALKAASQAGDAYKRVAVAAWPLRALIERGKVQHAQRVLTLLLAEAQQIQPPVSKLTALELLWEAAYPLGEAGRRPVVDALFAACHAADSWKAGRAMRDAALVIAVEDKPQAQRVIDSMRESPYKRQAQRRLDAGQLVSVRSFF